MNEQTASLLDRTLSRFRRTWRVAGARREVLRDVAPELPSGDVARLRQQIDACLDGRGGEVAARARAAELGEAYCRLNAIGRRRFLELLARDYDLDRDAVDTAIVKRQAAFDEPARQVAEAELRQALVAPRVRLLTQFNSLNQGVKFLVDMRSELIEIASEPALQALDRDFQSLLVAWFDIGFLDLARITWQTPAALLEKLIEYEAVHQIRSWDDLKNRLDSDRRCYGFFHPRMPDEPLIFVEVALVSGMAGNIQQLLDEYAPAENPLSADTAIFYSISNCQRGLAGVGFGDFLIKRVVDDLARDLPNLKAFATLSPIPDFGFWLEERLVAGDEDLLLEAEVRALKSIARSDSATGALKALLAHTDWYLDGAIIATLKPILLRLCSRYLLGERQGRRVRDRVAHFHLTNGARIERVNWLADVSERGLAQSAGMMVNYRYKLDEIEKNHHSYTVDGNVTAAADVRRLAKI